MKPGVRHRLDRLAMNQLGLVTRSDALHLGITTGQFRKLVSSRQLLRAQRGVYRTLGAPSTWEQAVLAACLSTGGTASHETACHLHGSPLGPAHPIVVTVAHGAREDEGLTVHRTRRLPDGDTTKRRRIPVTTPLRTLQDMAARLSDDQLLDLTTSFVATSAISVTDLRAQYVVGSSPGRRPGARRLRMAVVRLLEDAPYGSVAERRLEDALRAAGLPRAVRQHPIIGGDGKLIAVMDHAWPEILLDLEMDGFGPHSSPTAFNQNRLRDMRLTRLGWRVIRVTPSNLEKATDEVIATMWELTAGAGQPAVTHRSPR